MRRRLPIYGATTRTSLVTRHIRMVKTTAIRVTARFHQMDFTFFHCELGVIQKNEETRGQCFHTRIKILTFLSQNFELRSVGEISRVSKHNETHLLAIVYVPNPVQHDRLFLWYKYICSYRAGKLFASTGSRVIIMFRWCVCSVVWPIGGH